METPEIISQVAHLLRQQGVWNKDAIKEVKVRPEPVVAKDEVKLTEAGVNYTQATASEYDKEQNMKVERLKALVQNGNYHMDQDMVNSIATNIARMFV